jgi:hypothetical protein
MKNSLLPSVIVVLITLTTTALAQNLGGNVSTIFIAEDVQTRQGKLALDPGSHTILRFYDAVSFAFSRRSDILKAVNKGNDVVLYAMTEKAATDLSVLVDGKWHFFSVTIAKGAGLRFYEVKPRASSALPTDEAVHNAVNTASTATNAPASSASLISPTWLRWSLAPLRSVAGETLLSYTLENTGKERVVANDKGLRVLRAGAAVAFTLENNGRQILEPGAVFAGVIRVKAPSGPLRLQWSVRVMGTQESMVLEADVR